MPTFLCKNLLSGKRHSLCSGSAWVYFFSFRLILPDMRHTRARRHSQKRHWRCFLRSAFRPDKYCEIFSGEAPDDRRLSSRVQFRFSASQLNIIAVIVKPFYYLLYITRWLVLIEEAFCWKVSTSFICLEVEILQWKCCIKTKQLKSFTAQLNAAFSKTVFDINLVWQTNRVAFNTF